MNIFRAALFGALLMLSACGNQQAIPTETETEKGSQQTTSETTTNTEASSKQATNPTPSAKPSQLHPPTEEEPKQPSKRVAAPSSSAPPPPSEAVPSPVKTAPTPATTTSAPPSEEKKSEVVYLSIRGDEQRGVILDATEAPYVEGDTVLSVLAKTLKEKQIPLDYSGSGRTAYVKGIANLYEFDHGPLSGWLYRVNGVFRSESAGAYKLQPGDRIEWLYTLDLGKDIGAEP